MLYYFLWFWHFSHLKLANYNYLPLIVSAECALKVAWQALTVASWENKKGPYLQAYGQQSLKTVQMYHFFLLYFNKYFMMSFL